MLDIVDKGQSKVRSPGTACDVAAAKVIQHLLAAGVPDMDADNKGWVPVFYALQEGKVQQPPKDQTEC